MKPIKFRQFVDGKFHYWGYIEEDGRTYFELPVDRRPIVPSDQFTGLKDNNGKEIYKGDIVIFRASDVIGNYEVRFGEYQTELEHMLCWYAQGKLLAYALSLAMPCEVIGNIYENEDYYDLKR